MALPENLLSELRQIVGDKNVLTEKEDLIPYSFDGTAALQQMPGCVVFATITEQIAGVLKLANEKNLAVALYAVDCLYLVACSGLCHFNLRDVSAFYFERSRNPTQYRN